MSVSVVMHMEIEEVERVLANGPCIKWIELNWKRRFGNERIRPPTCHRVIQAHDGAVKHLNGPRNRVDIKREFNAIQFLPWQFDSRHCSDRKSVV